MSSIKTLIPCLILLACLFTNANATVNNQASEIVQAAIDNWRGLTSYGVFSMTIHREDWQRSMTMKSWTKGDNHSLIRIIQPKKDIGSGTLLIEQQMWTYTPKLNRIIKIPSSMMNQSWMGSDFSNKDISRADDIIKLYQHRLIDTQQSNGHKVFTIEAIPMEDAAVVWGKEILKIRDDFVLISHAFYDQDDVLFKVMKSYEIKTLSGRPVATRQRMTRTDNEHKWTELNVQDIEFDIKLPEQTFTLTNLRQTRR